MPLLIPWVLELEFYRAGARHQLFVAYCVHGQKFVGLHIHTYVDIWSGWHGAWKHNGDILDVKLFYQEKICLFKFRRVVGQFYNLMHAGDSLWVTAQITMLPMTQNQISDISCGPLPLDCSRTKHHRGLRTKHNQDTCLRSML